MNDFERATLRKRAVAMMIREELGDDLPVHVEQSSLTLDFATSRDGFHLRWVTLREVDNYIARKGLK